MYWDIEEVLILVAIVVLPRLDTMTMTIRYLLPWLLIVPLSVLLLLLLVHHHYYDDDDDDYYYYYYYDDGTYL